LLKGELLLGIESDKLDILEKKFLA